jgi:hypothetical protein
MKSTDELFTLYYRRKRRIISNLSMFACLLHPVVCFVGVALRRGAPRDTSLEAEPHRGFLPEAEPHGVSTPDASVLGVESVAPIMITRRPAGT